MAWECTNMQMLLPMLDKATEFISECLQNRKLEEKLRTGFPEEFDKINWAQELLLELFYILKDIDRELIMRNIDIAREATEKGNFELNRR